MYKRNVVEETVIAGAGVLQLLRLQDRDWGTSYALKWKGSEELIEKERGSGYYRELGNVLKRRDKIIAGGGLTT